MSPLIHLGWLRDIDLPNRLCSRDYIRDANAQRKFDDAQTLKASLDDIKAEIERVAAGEA